MQERHQDKARYFRETGVTTKKFVIPYVEQSMTISPESRILEIGCGEGGNLVPFLERGCDCVGIDIDRKRIAQAREFMAGAAPEGRLQLIAEDIYEVDTDALGTFDLIFMRDVIEHIPAQEKFLGFVKRLMHPGSRMFFGFPPWRMPFGGHQQVCVGKLMSKLPWFHLLPMPLFKGVLRTAGEPEWVVKALEGVKETGISTARFEAILRREGYVYDRKTRFLINPNYETKFGLTPRALPGILAGIPWVRDFYTTCYYCLVRLP